MENLWLCSSCMSYFVGTGPKYTHTKVKLLGFVNLSPKNKAICNVKKQAQQEQDDNTHLSYTFYMMHIFCK